MSTAPSRAEYSSNQWQAVRWTGAKVLNVLGADLDRARNEYQSGHYVEAEASLDRLMYNLEQMIRITFMKRHCGHWIKPLL